MTFLEFLETFFDDGFGTVVELGGNDYHLPGSYYHDQLEFVVDPVCEQIDGTSVIDGINVLGRFVENVDIRKEIGQVNLVVRHTLEHVASPLALLEQLFTQCPDECLFVFEVPSLSNASYRFDAVFHQYYFDVDSFKYLIAKAVVHM